MIYLESSGNGMMEKELGDLLTEIDAHVDVIDCLPNMSADGVSARTKPLVKQLRTARPTTPIVLVEDRNYTNSWLFKEQRDRNLTSQAALKKAYEELVNEGVPGLFYVSGASLLGDATEGAVDSSHPKDLGFLRQAEAFDKVLARLCR